MIKQMAAIRESRIALWTMGALAIAALIVIAALSSFYRADWMWNLAFLPIGAVLLVAMIDAREEISDTVRMVAKVVFWVSIPAGIVLGVWLFIDFAPHWLIYAIEGWAVVMWFLYWISRHTDSVARSAVRDELSRRGL